MTIYYNGKTGGFYDTAIVGDNVPSGSVEVSKEIRKIMLDGEAAGQIIVPDVNGKPVLVDPPTPTPEETEAKIAAAVQQARQTAYRNESDPIYFRAQRGEATMDEWLLKIEEIKTRYPEGVMPQ